MSEIMSLERRGALRAAASAAALLPLGAMAPFRTVHAICTVGIPVADQRGNFNFGGSTDQLLEAISTGKGDAGAGMALRWLKPPQQGFDVKITTAIHGGCPGLLGLPA